jgi:hypothetical protein
MIGDATYTAVSAYPLAFTVFNNALWGSGTNVTVTLTTGTAAIVYFGARYVAHPTLGANVQLSYDVTSGTTISASVTWGTVTESDPGGTLISAGRAHLQTGLNAASNTFRLVGLVSSGAAATTATHFNQHVRDNMLEQENPTATTAGDLVYADAANSMGSRVGLGGSNFSLVSTGSAPVWRDTGYDSYPGVLLANVYFLGDPTWFDIPDTSVTLTTGTQALVMFGARFVQHSTAGANVQMSYRISGASSIDASAVWGTANESDPAGTLTSVFRANLHTGLTAGSNTFIPNGFASTFTSDVFFGWPWILVEAL